MFVKANLFVVAMGFLPTLVVSGASLRQIEEPAKNMPNVLALACADGSAVACNLMGAAGRRLKMMANDGIDISDRLLEDACDPYSGRAYGLCNAFCNAKKCHEAEFENAKGCIPVKQNFQAATGEENFPCETRCPCWDSFALMLDDGEIIGLFQSYENTTTNTDFYILTTGSEDTGAARYFDAFTGDGSHPNGLAGSYCTYDETGEAQTLLQTTVEEHDVCVLDIVKFTREAPSEQGKVPCDPYPDVPEGVVCPCWDGSSEERAVLDEASVLMIDGFRDFNATIYLKNEDELREYGYQTSGVLDNDDTLIYYCWQQQRELGSFGDPDSYYFDGSLTFEQHKACYNDIAARSTSEGVNAICQG